MPVSRNYLVTFSKKKNRTKVKKIYRDECITKFKEINVIFQKNIKNYYFTQYSSISFNQFSQNEVQAFLLF